MAYLLRALWFAGMIVLSARLLNRSNLLSNNPYNFAVNVTFGTVAGASILQVGRPIWDGTLAIAGLTLFAWAANALATRSERFHRLLAGETVPLVRRGEVVQAGLDRLRMSRGDLRRQLRHMRLGGLADIEAATMDPAGQLGVVERPSGQAETRGEHGPGPGAGGPPSPPPAPSDRRPGG